MQADYEPTAILCRPGDVTRARVPVRTAEWPMFSIEMCTPKAAISVEIRRQFIRF